MKRFSSLLCALILTSSRKRKLNLLKDYFAGTPDPDRGYALAALTGELSFRLIKSKFFKDLIKERTDPFLFEVSYDYVGDLAETIALLWEPKTEGEIESISKVYNKLSSAKKDTLLPIITNILDSSTNDQRWALIKLFTGGLRIGVSNRLTKQALAEYGAVELEDVEKIWHGLTYPYLNLFSWLEKSGPKPRIDHHNIFHPMMLANPINVEKDFKNLEPELYLAEFKWDGIRVQLVSDRNNNKLYSRTGDNISKSFPDLLDEISGNFVFDGELLAGEKNNPLSFNELQKRLNKKAPTKAFMKKHPVFIKIYDVLYFKNKDLRNEPLVNRKEILNDFFSKNSDPLYLSEALKFDTWDDLKSIKNNNYDKIYEGLMLKLLSSKYTSGRPKGPWFKWKRDPKQVEAILMYAQRGHGKRSSFFSDFTFGLYDKKNELVPIGKAYSGFTDEELNQLDKFVRNNTVNKFGPVREVKKILILEVAFDDLSISSRHKSGIAMRFPRIKRIRWDKPINEVSTLEEIKNTFLNVC